MQTFTATEAKSKLGLVLDMSQKSPVLIEKQGRPFAVVMSQDEYQRLEDAYWILEARKAEKSGFLSSEESTAILEKLHKKHVKPQS